MAARSVEAVAIRDDESGIELRVLALAPSDDGSVRVEIRIEGRLGDLVDGKLGEQLVGVSDAHIKTTMRLDMNGEAANELRLGLERALRKSTIEKPKGTPK